MKIEEGGVEYDLSDHNLITVKFKLTVKGHKEKNKNSNKYQKKSLPEEK